MSKQQLSLSIIGGVGASVAAALILVSFVTGLSDILFGNFFYQTVLFALVLGLVGMAAARAGTVNLGVWVTTLAGFLMSIETTAITVAAHILRDQPALFNALSDGQLAPADAPRAAAIALLPEKLWVVSLGGFLTLGLLLFPDGRFPSRRWRIIGAVSVVGIASFTVGNLLLGLPNSTIPWATAEPMTLPSFLLNLGLPLVGVSILASVASLFVRYRRADSERQHQIKWMLFGAGVFALSFVGVFVGTVIAGVDDSTVLPNYVSLITLPLVLMAYGIGIVRYRLYEIDVVINRTLVFGTLAVFITGVYVAVVVGLGTLLGNRSSLGLAIAATALVAVVFEPVRARVQHWANVVVYGRRATPYEVLAGMTGQGRTPEEQLRDAVRLLGEGTGAEETVIWSGTDERSVAAIWPREADPSHDDSWDIEVPLRSEDEQVGAVTIRKRRGDHPSPQDRRLVEEFAGQASLLVANNLLNQQLRNRLIELTESRRRLVTAQDETRRKLERDLHDGAQQQLVALMVNLGMAKSMAERENAQKVAQTLEGVAHDAHTAAGTLRDLARGIFPPLLEAEGLVTSLRAQAEKVAVPVQIDAGEVGRYPRDIESAVYFCVLEALNNVAKYAEASRVEVGLSEQGGLLNFSVSDDGVGFDPAEVGFGTGLHGMADRLDTVGGELEVTSVRGRGTMVQGRIPVEATEVAGVC